MKTSDDFEALHPPGRPIATAVSTGGIVAHILPIAAPYEEADEYRMLCGAAFPDFWYFPIRLPLCERCVELWQAAAAIDAAARRNIA